MASMNSAVGGSCFPSAKFWSSSNTMAKSRCFARAVEVSIPAHTAGGSQRALTCSKEEPVLAHANSNSVISATNSVPAPESVVQQLEISLRRLTLLPVPERDASESRSDDEQSMTTGLDRVPDSHDAPTEMLLPARLRRFEKSAGFRRRKKMPPQPAWNSDDFARNAECILDSILSEPSSQGVQKSLDSWLGQVTRVELGKVIKALGYRKQPHLAMDVFCWMGNQRGRLKPNPHVYCTIIGMLGRAGMVEKAREIFDDRGLHNSRSVHLYNAMIGAYVKCGDFPRAWSLYKDTWEGGLQADEVTFNTLFNGIARNEVPLRTIETILAQMKEAGIAPSRYTYNTVLSALSKFGQLDRAAAIFEEMQSSRETPDLITFNIVINMYKRAGQQEKALDAFDSLLDSGFCPDATTYTTLMQLWSKADDVEAALEEFNEIQRTGGTPDVVAFSSLVHIHGRAGNIEQAEKVFKEMRGAGMQPNIVTWSSLIQAYGKKGMVGKVESCFADMQRCGCQLDASLSNIMMGAYAQAGFPDRAAMLFRRMHSAGVKPDAACFNTMIHAFAKSGQRQNAEAVHQEMIEAGFAADKLSRRCFNRLANGRRVR